MVGALVYATPTPFQQFQPVERATDANGWATLPLRRLRYFPVSGRQQLLSVFVRARNPAKSSSEEFRRAASSHSQYGSADAPSRGRADRASSREAPRAITLGSARAMTPLRSYRTAQAAVDDLTKGARDGPGDR